MSKSTPAELFVVQFTRDELLAMLRQNSPRDFIRTKADLASAAAGHRRVMNAARAVERHEAKEAEAKR